VEKDACRSGASQNAINGLVRSVLLGAAPGIGRKTFIVVCRSSDRPDRPRRLPELPLAETPRL